MWTSTSMTVADSIMLSGMGLLTVVSALAMLAIIIMVFSRLMDATAKPKTAVAGSAAPVEEPGISEETCAMVLSVICEELSAAPEEINITSIREL